MSERPSVFVGVSSLPTDFTGTLDNCRFGKSPTYVFDGKMPTVLMFTILSDELEQPLDKELLSIGGGFEVAENGTLAVREGKGGEGFGDNSNIQRWIDRLMDIDEAAVLKHYEDTQYPPQDARFWEGLTTVFVREKTPQDIANGRQGRLMPTESVSWAETAAPAKPATKGKAKAKPKAKAAPKAETNGAGELDPAILKQIDDIADASGDYDEYLQQVFAKVDEAQEEPFYSKVMEGEEVEGSIWQRAIARAAE